MKRQKQSSSFHLYSVKTELGWMSLLWSTERNDDELAALTFGHPTRKSAEERARNYFPTSTAEQFIRLSDDALSATQQRVVSLLSDYQAGLNISFAEVKLDLSFATPFQKRVLRECRAIPSGECKTYGELAGLAGSPKAARAVGSVMASNRFPLIIPCHRVIGSCGELRGFSAPQGLKLKEKLLLQEAAV